MFQYQWRPQFNMFGSGQKPEQRERPVQSPPVTSPRSLSLQGTPTPSRKIRNVNLIQHLISCGTVNCSRTSDRAEHTQAREGQGIIGAGRDIWRSPCPARATPRWLPRTLPSPCPCPFSPSQGRACTASLGTLPGG